MVNCEGGRGMGGFGRGFVVGVVITVCVVVVAVWRTGV